MDVGITVVGYVSFAAVNATHVVTFPDAVAVAFEVTVAADFVDAFVLDAAVDVFTYF